MTDATGAPAELPAGPRIDSPANEALKRVRKLRRARERARESAFLVEGFRELSRAVEGGIGLEALFVCPDRWTGRSEPALVHQVASAGTRISVLSLRAFESIAIQDDPDGLLAVASRPDVSLRQQPAVAIGALFVAAEGIERPGNLGTIVRACVAADVSGLILCDPQVDVFHPEVVRASVGTLFSLPLSVVPTGEFVGWARSAGVRLVVTTPAANDYYWQADVCGSTALVVGSEKRGVGEAMLAGADQLVRIPMSDRIDSINVGVAAGVVLFDAVRARVQSQDR